MHIKYLIQPEIQIGEIFKSFLTSTPSPTQVVLVSAFANMQTAKRFKEDFLNLFASGVKVSIILGIDMGGTTLELLQELQTWNMDIRVIKNQSSGHTFHPKFFIIEYNDYAVISVGSHNFTEGGFYNNYECGVQITYEFPADTENYENAIIELNRFINPYGSVCQNLSLELLNYLSECNIVPTEQERKHNRKLTRQNIQVKKEKSPFGSERFPSPPKIPEGSLENAVSIVNGERKRKKIDFPGQEIISLDYSVGINPTVFYMMLPKMQGSNIPGEGRIPIAARDIAEDFWGWPDRYELKVSPRGGTDRQYLNWKPIWVIVDSENPDELFKENVRMYDYVNSSDYRFYSARLVNMGADTGDIVKITRVMDADIEFECVLARKDSEAYKKWLSFCTQKVKGKNVRYWGYA